MATILVGACSCGTCARRDDAATPGKAARAFGPFVHRRRESGGVVSETGTPLDPISDSPTSAGADPSPEGTAMTYGVVHQFKGGTKEQYEASIAAVHPADGSLPPGQLFHAAGPSATGGRSWRSTTPRRSWRPSATPCSCPAWRPASRAGSPCSGGDRLRGRQRGPRLTAR